MAQTIGENRTGYQFHAATREEIQQALQQEIRDNRVKNVGKAILRILLFPVLLVVFMLKWIGTFCVRISAWILNLVAELMVALAVVYLIQGDGRNAMIGFIVGAVIFLIPTVSAFLIALMGIMQERLHEFIWNSNK